MAVIIDELTKQRIHEAAQILDVVSDFVSLRRKGADYVGLCPFHSDRNPSFHVSPAKNYCKCFSCGEGGNPVTFVMKHEQLSYVDALKYLANKYGIPIQEREETPEERLLANERESLFQVNEYAAKYFHELLLHSTEGKDIGLSYFTERGIRMDSIQKFGLGYASTDKTAFSEAAIRKGYSESYLVTAGLSARYEEGKPLHDKYRGRVIFPIHSISGKVVGLGGRILSSKEKIAKYINSPENPIYSKSRELYGLYYAKRSISREDRCYLVEGYLDVIQMHQSGIENVVSSSGTALTEGQIRLIYRFTRNVTLLYDGDAPGIKAALRGVDMLLAAGMQIKIVLLPDGEDPDSYARSRSAEEFKAYIAANEQDFIGFKTDILLADAEHDPIERARVIGDLIGSISLIPDAIGRSVYVQSTAQRLSMDESLLLNEVNKRRRNPRGSTHFSDTTGTYDRSIVPTPAVLPTGSESSQSNAPRQGGQYSVQDVYPSPQEEKQVANPPTLGSLPPYESELVRLVLRYGSKVILIDKVQQRDEISGEDIDVEFPVTLALFVKEEFVVEQTLCEFIHPLSLQIIQEAAEVCLQQVDCDTEVYFLNHTDPIINRLSLDLLFEKYTPSRLLKPQSFVDYTEEDAKKGAMRDMQGLFNRAVRAIYDVRNAYTLREIRATQGRIAECQKAGKREEISDLLDKLNRLGEVKRLLSKELGDRTII